jgi:hypothetical protein
MMAMFFRNVFLLLCCKLYLVCSELLITPSPQVLFADEHQIDIRGSGFTNHSMSIEMGVPGHPMLVMGDDFFLSHFFANGSGITLVLKGLVHR